MKALGASRQWAIGATVVFGLAQLWAAYHLCARLQGYNQTVDGLQWLVIGAVVLMVAGEVLTAVSGAREK
jgi:hypothetical protein